MIHKQIEFTVELKEKTLTVVAERVYIVEGVLNFYNIRMTSVVAGFSCEEKDIVGSFSDYKNFYVKGGSDE